LTARLILSCGEPSGDLYAGALVRELRALDPSTQVRGLGGPEFAAAGGDLVADYRGLSVTGLTEAVGKIPQSFATMRRLVDESPQALASLNPELPPWFIAIVDRLLEKDPSRRWTASCRGRERSGSS